MAAKDILLLSMPGLLSFRRLETDQEYMAQFRFRMNTAHAALLHWLLDNGFLVDPARWTGYSDWENFVLRSSDVTAEGFQLFKGCLHRWLSSLDRKKGHFDDVKLWDKELAKLRAEGVIGKAKP